MNPIRTIHADHRNIVGLMTRKFLSVAVRHCDVSAVGIGSRRLHCSVCCGRGFEWLRVTDRAEVRSPMTVTAGALRPAPASEHRVVPGAEGSGAKLHVLEDGAVRVAGHDPGAVGNFVGRFEDLGARLAEGFENGGQGADDDGPVL